MDLPERFENVEHLEDVMTTPSAALVADLERVPGDLIVLGAGGKMGVRLAANLKGSAYDVDHVEISADGRARLREAVGVDCVTRDEALARFRRLGR